MSTKQFHPLLDVLKHIKHIIFISLCIIFAASLSLNGVLLYQNKERNTVVRVVDGDSVDLADGRRIRLLGVDTPEKGRCGFEEARNRLLQLAENKYVRLTDLITDDYGRTLANVFAGKTFINALMIKEGLGRYTGNSGTKTEAFRQAHTYALHNKPGIYATRCRNATPPGNCVIKGNIKEGQKTYHLPGCRNYDQTIIDESFGDQWFCTENEAQAAGFSKAAACP